MIIQKPKVLVIDDEASVRSSLKLLLGKSFDVSSAESGIEAIKSLDHFTPDVVLLDLLLPDLDGIETLKQLKTKNPTTPVVMLSGANAVKGAVEAMKCGAVDYINKPFEFEELEKLITSLVQEAGAAKKALEEILIVEKPIEASIAPKITLIGESPAIKDITTRITQVAEKDTTVLITGESGTGKEVIAKLIHQQSTRSRGPFVAINCGAIPESLIESELFGHEKGAFTHAIERRIGHCELANGGTLFLDEIGELSLGVQVKLLRFLQEQEFFRVGRSKSIKVDVRIITATNRKLENLISEKRFRADLYYRINVVNFLLPPLRDRVGDIPLLITHFVEKLSKRYGGRVLTFNDHAIELISGYRWPGNIRELENFIESLFALSAHDHITAADIPARLKEEVTEEAQSFHDATEDLSREMIERALKQVSYNQTKAASLLGVTRRILKYRMDRLGIRGEV